MEIPTIDVVIRVKTQQVIIPGQTAENDLPQRHWKIELCMLNEEDKEIEIDILSNCVFYLHETFVHPIRSLDRPPFTIEEDGWGEFEIRIVCEFIENGGKFTIRHPLTFDESSYAIDYDIKVPYQVPLLKELLSKHFKVPETTQHGEKEGRFLANSWMNRIATADQDTVTEIVQMIVSHPAVQHEMNKRPRREDFLLGIHQLPDELVKRIGEYVCNRGSSE